MGVLSLDRAKEIEKRMVTAMERELRTIVAAQDLEHEMNLLRKERARREVLLQEKKRAERLEQQRVRAEHERVHREKRQRVFEHQERQREILADYEREKREQASLRAQQYEQERQLQLELVNQEAERKAVYMMQVRKLLEEREQERKEEIFHRMKLAEARLAQQNENIRKEREEKIRIERVKEVQRERRREEFREQQASEHKEMILRIAEKYSRSDRLKTEQAAVVHSLTMLKKEFSERKEEVSRLARLASRTGNMDMIYAALVTARQPGTALARSTPVSPREMGTPRLDTPTATKFLQQYGLDGAIAPPSPRPAFSPVGRKQASPTNSSPPASPMPPYPMSPVSPSTTLSGPVSRPSIKVQTIAGLRHMAAAEDSPAILSGRTHAEESPSRRSVRSFARVTISEHQDSFQGDDVPEAGETYRRLMRLYESRAATSAR